MERAKVRFQEALRATALRAQVAAAKDAEIIRDYLDQLEHAHGAGGELHDWLAWGRTYVDSIDPLVTAPTLPAVPREVTADDLKPFLRPGVSPYGPSR